MAEDLETKSRKAVLAIKDKITDIDNVLRDLSMKLCYLIKGQGYASAEHDSYGKDFESY